MRKAGIVGGTHRAASLWDDAVKLAKANGNGKAAKGGKARTAGR